eukprot:scaffold283316_cov44-Prasinocladus_malaysianus.AAC.2
MIRATPRMSSGPSLPADNPLPPETLSKATSRLPITPRLTAIQLRLDIFSPWSTKLHKYH